MMQHTRANGEKMELSWDANGYILQFHSPGSYTSSTHLAPEIGAKLYCALWDLTKSPKPDVGPGTLKGLTITIDGPRNSGKTWWANQIKQLRSALEKLDQRPFGVRYPTIIDLGNLRPEEQVQSLSDWRKVQLGAHLPSQGKSAYSAPPEYVTFSWMGRPYFVQAAPSVAKALRDKLATAQLWPLTHTSPDALADIHQAGVETALRARIKSLEANRAGYANTIRDQRATIDVLRGHALKQSNELATVRKLSELRSRDLVAAQMARDEALQRVATQRQSLAYLEATVATLRDRIQLVLKTLKQIAAATSEPDLLRSHLALLCEHIDRTKQ